MTRIQNVVATPLLGQACSLHSYIFNYIFPCPLQFIFEKGKIRLKAEKILQRKYMTFLTFLVFVTGIIGLGSCAFILSIQIFKPMENLSMVALFFCLFLGTCSFFECGVYLIFILSREIVPALNQLFAIERTCKSLENRIAKIITFDRIYFCMFQITNLTQENQSIG